MRDSIDIPLESLGQPGNIWINKKSGQLRYSLSKNTPDKWVAPLSEYQVGNIAGNDAKTFIKRGQPVSIGFIDELASELRTSGDPCVVPTNPHTHQWCIGIALEPGNADRSDGSLDHIHVLSHGQIEYTLDDLNNADRKDLIYLPPYTTDPDGKKRFVWNYNDIGKPVLVSNFEGEEGGLTIDYTHAYFAGANILTVGRIADAPVPRSVSTTDDDQRIIIEIQLAGDVRGMIDSTQFDVELEISPNTLPIYTNHPQDRLIFVKILDDPDEANSSRALGRMITNDEILLENGGVNSPIGCFLAKSENGTIDLNKFNGQTVLLHRLGIVEADFGFTENDFGKDLYLNAGMVTTTGTALGYEYKVGVVINSGRVLVDCRYPRIFGQFEMIGKIKPAYTDRQTGQLVTDPGYIVIDPSHVHRTNKPWAGDPNSPLIDFSELVKIIMYQGVMEYSDDPAGPFVNVNGSWTFDNTNPVDMLPTDPDYIPFIRDGYFKFKNIYYSSDGNVASQIKYSSEGAPDSIQYLWPEIAFDVVIPPGANDWSITSSPISLDISKLANLGAYIDGAGNNIEAYEIYCKLPTELGGRYISPGFSTFWDTESGRNKWYGYEWAIGLDKYTQTWRLKMITNPGATEDIMFSQVQPEDNYGFCYPPGQRLSQELPLKIFVRRRPVQYHNLFLNELNAHNPWVPHITSEGNIVTDEKLYFGRAFSGITEDPNETYWQIDWRGASSLQFSNLSKNGIGGRNIYKKILATTIGPYYEGFTAPTHLVNQLVVRYQPVNLSGEFISGYRIDWTYDFDNNIVQLGAEFAPKLLSYPTTMSGDEKRVEVYEDYIAGATSDNVSGYYTVPRSAMKTLHEIPTQFFNYTDDTDLSHYRIHTIQEAWNKSGNNIERYQPADFEREIFPPVSGVYQDGTRYSYTSNPYEIDISKQLEWEHIQEEIGYVFNSILRNSNGNIIRGGDTTYIHTNLGLLNHASKETQDRLLRLERSLFGADYETIPNGLGLEQDYSHFSGINQTLHNWGISRELQFLYDQQFLNLSGANNLYSEYNTILWALYGDYTSLDTYENVLPNTGYNTPRNNFHNHFPDVYLWYLANSGYNGPHYNHYSNILEPLSEDYRRKQDGTISAVYDARKIYFSKYFDGYYSETGTDKLPEVRYPFMWPIDIQPNWSGINPEYSFFNTVSFGDRAGQELPPENPDSLGKKFYSLDMGSLESVIYDLIAKLSWVKHTTDNRFYNYLPEYVNLSKISGWFETSSITDYYKYTNNTLPNRHALIDKYINAISGGYYSAFLFQDEKRLLSNGLKLKTIHSISNLTNPYKNILENKINLTTKNILSFDHIPFKMENRSIKNLLKKDIYKLVDKNLNTYTWSGINDTDNEAFNGEEGEYFIVGFYYPVNNIETNRVYMRKNETSWDAYIRLFENYEEDVYFHFQPESPGKIPYVPEQYIQSYNDVKTNLGEFVMAHNNEFYLGESGYYFISGISGREAEGYGNYEPNSKNFAARADSYFYIRNGISGVYFYNNNVRIEEKDEQHSYNYREQINKITDPVKNITVERYFTGRKTDFLTSISGYKSLVDFSCTPPNYEGTNYYVSGESGYTISGIHGIRGTYSGFGTIEYKQDVYIRRVEYIYDDSTPYDGAFHSTKIIGVSSQILNDYISGTMSGIFNGTINSFSGQLKNVKIENFDGFIKGNISGNTLGTIEGKVTGLNSGYISGKVTNGVSTYYSGFMYETDPTLGEDKTGVSIPNGYISGFVKDFTASFEGILETDNKASIEGNVFEFSSEELTTDIDYNTIININGNISGISEGIMNGSYNGSNKDNYTIFKPVLKNEEGHVDNNKYPAPTTINLLENNIDEIFLKTSEDSSEDLDIFISGSQAGDYFSGRIENNVAVRGMPSRIDFHIIDENDKWNYNYVRTSNSKFETVYKNSMHYLDTPQHANIDFIDGIKGSPLNSAKWVLEGQVEFDIRNNNLEEQEIQIKTMSEALPHMTGLIPVISGEYSSSGVLLEDVHLQVASTFEHDFKEISGILTTDLVSGREIRIKEANQIGDVSGVYNIIESYSGVFYSEVPIPGPGAITTEIQSGIYTVNFAKTGIFNFDSQELEFTLEGFNLLPFTEDTLVGYLKTGTLSINNTDYIHGENLSGKYALTNIPDIPPDTLNYNHPMTGQYYKYWFSGITGMSGIYNLTEVNHINLLSGYVVNSIPVEISTNGEEVGIEGDLIFKGSEENPITLTGTIKVGIYGGIEPFTMNITNSFAAHLEKVNISNIEKPIAGLHRKSIINLSDINTDIFEVIPKENYAETIIISGDTHNIPMHNNIITSGLIPSSGNVDFDSGLHSFILSGYTYEEINTPLDVGAESGYYISGVTDTTSGIIGDLNEILDTLKGTIWVSSGRLLSRNVTVEADLNEKPVTYIQHYTMLPEWYNKVNQPFVEKTMYLEDNGKWSEASGPHKGWIANPALFAPLLLAVDINTLEEIITKIPTKNYFDDGDNNPPLPSLVTIRPIKIDLPIIGNIDIPGGQTVFIQENNDDELSEGFINDLKKLSYTVAAGQTTTTIYPLEELSNDEIRAFFIKQTFYMVNGEYELEIFAAPRIVKDYFTEITDTLDNKETEWVRQNFPWYPTNYMSGASLLISGEVTYDNSGIFTDGKDNAGSGILIEQTDISGIVNGKYNIQHLESYYNSGIIYGKHVTDDVDISVNIKLKDHLENNLTLAIDEPQICIRNYSKEEFEEVEIIPEICTDGTVYTIHETEKFKNCYYTMLVPTDNQGSIDNEYRLLKPDCIITSNKFAVKYPSDNDGKRKVEIVIIPGILTKEVQFQFHYEKQDPSDPGSDTLLIIDEHESMSYRPLIVDINEKADYSMRDYLGLPTPSNTEGVIRII